MCKCVCVCVCVVVVVFVHLSISQPFVMVHPTLVPTNPLVILDAYNPHGMLVPQWLELLSDINFI